MANGECVVGARNATKIESMEHEMAELKAENRELKKCVEGLQLGRARLDGWSALVIALIAGAASIIGPWLVAIAQAKQ